MDTLDWLLILGRRHLERTLRSYTTHCNRERSHRGLGLLTPEPADTAGPPTTALEQWPWDAADRAAARPRRGRR